MHLALQLVITFVCLGMLANGLINGWRIRRDRRLMRGQALPPEPPLISVCVPARNEARNIEACLESLARQQYPHFEVLALDDCSEDETHAIAARVAARYGNVHVLRGEPLPPGWIGKPHACEQLARAARGEWLLFTDADTVFAPHALTRAFRLALARRADLLSGLPGMRTVTFWERLSVPMLALIGVGAANFELITRLRWPWYGAASGAFLFFRRTAYDAFGGHTAVRDRIVEDVALGRRTKQAGGRLVMTDVTDLVACRMYTTFAEVWEGFTKNFYAAFPGPLFPLVVLGLLGVFVLPWFFFLFGGALGGGALAGFWLPLVQIASVGTLKAAVDLRAGTPRFVDLLLTPLAGLLMAVIATRSASRHLLKQPTPWRARHYELWKS